MKTRQPSWLSLLHSRACQNQAARVSRAPDGALTLHVRNIRPTYLKPPISWIVPFKPERRLELDSIGSYLWSLCDGTQTMEQVIDAFAGRYQLTFHEARTAVSQHIQSLVKYGAVAMIVPGEDVTPL